MANIEKTLKETLDKMLRENVKITGYTVNGQKISIFVEDEETATSLQTIAFEGYQVNIIVTGRLEALGV